jgi:kynurenine formamidase
MKSVKRVGAVWSKTVVPWMVLATLVPLSAAGQQGWVPLPREKRCPSAWGATDERGAANLQTPELVLKATRLVREGRMFELGKVLDADMPKFGPRQFSLFTAPTTQPTGRGQERGNEELVVSELGQIGTQVDSLAHITIGNELYNCFDNDKTMTRRGFTHLGVERIGTLFTRGVMLDIAALKGVDVLPDRYEITVADLQQAMARQGVEIGKGDFVAIRTGWGRLWSTQKEKFAREEPGVGVAAAEWLVARHVMVIGSDNWGIDVFPHPDDLRFPVHQVTLVTAGVFLLENLELEELAKEKIYEFAFVLQPLKMRGATGSTVAPTAIR